MDLYIARDGNESGPYTADQIESLHRAGMLRSQDLVWHEGMDEWTAVHRYLGLRPPVPTGKNGRVPTHDEQSRSEEGLHLHPATRSGVTARAAWEIFVPIVLTLGLYCVYLLPRQSWEIGRITATKRVNPWILGCLIVVTFGLFGIFYQILLAWKFQTISQKMHTPGRNASLGTAVMVFSLSSIALAYSSAEFGVFISVILGLIPFWLVQKEINAHLEDSRAD